MIKIWNSYLVELNYATAPAAGSTLNFKDVPFLKDVWIYGIEVITADQMSVSPSSATMATKANTIKGSLTIQDGNVEKLYQVPNGQLITQDNAGIVKEFQPMKINLTKCYVQMYAAGINAGESICFNFIYLNDNELKSFLASKR